MELAINVLALLTFIYFLILLPDRVFRFDCSTRQVYEEGAKEVSLSVVNGINCKYNPSYLICHNFVLVTFLNFKKFGHLKQ